MPRARLPRARLPRARLHRTRLYRNGVLEAEGFPVAAVSDHRADSSAVGLFVVFRRKDWL